MENEHWKTIGDALKEARRSLELSQRQTGVTLGMLPSLYVAVEEGVANPIDALKKFFELTGEHEGTLKAVRANARGECSKLNREIKNLSHQIDAIRAVFKNKANDKNWEPGETLAESFARVMKERDEAREALARISEAAVAVLDRWEQPAWKDTEPTAAVIYRLRDALGRGEK